MHRIDGPGATNDNLFTEGDPVQGVPATTVTGAWLNAVQEEIANAVEEAGITLNKIETDQLAQAIYILAGRAAGWSTGDVKLTMKTTADLGWIMCNDGTIGKTGSAGTTRANDDCQALFTLLWNNVSNVYAPVTGGRGTSAAADWAAGKTIALTKMLGRSMAVGGAGAGLSSRTLGQTAGAETHTLQTTEMPSHAHGVTDPGHAHAQGGVALWFTGPGPNDLVIDGTGAAGTDIDLQTSLSVMQSAATGVTIQNSGGGGAHNIMQPTAFLNAMIKL